MVPLAFRGQRATTSRRTRLHHKHEHEVGIAGAVGLPVRRGSGFTPKSTGDPEILPPCPSLELLAGADDNRRPKLLADTLDWATGKGAAVAGLKLALGATCT